MHFQRNIYNDLKDWKSKVKRKPLLLMGARQIGKTTVLKSFGKNEYENFIYLNLEKNQDVNSFFTGNKDPQAILENLGLFSGKKIDISNSLIVLDEIQENRDAITALKYFAEEMPEVHIIGAGSLLGLTIGNTSSFPVGKVEFLQMFPLTFSEYLASKDPKLFQTFQHFLEKPEITPLENAFFNPLKSTFKEYLLFGGMPEVAADFIENKNIASAQKIQDDILQAYTLDFVKHAPKSTSTKIQQVWNSIPSQLAKENKKFIYKLIKSGARAREYEEAIQWLIEAGLVYKVANVSKANSPLKAYKDLTAYKIYVFETGLLMRLAGIDPNIYLNTKDIFSTFNGSLAENFVCSSLLSAFKNKPNYWTSEGKAEIDFIIEHKENIIPIEVKSGEQTKAKSLAVYEKKYSPDIRIRISNLNVKQTGNLINIPLFYAEHIKQFIKFRAIYNEG